MYQYINVPVFGTAIRAGRLSGHGLFIPGPGGGGGVRRRGVHGYYRCSMGNLLFWGESHIILQKWGGGGGGGTYVHAMRMYWTRQKIYFNGYCIIWVAPKRCMCKFFLNFRIIKVSLLHKYSQGTDTCTIPIYSNPCDYFI